MHPIEIELEEHGTLLRIVWLDKTESIIPSGQLRNLCQCSECTSRRSFTHGISLALATDAANRIRSVDLPSSSSLFIQWEDGHDKSWFKFSTLLEEFPGQPRGVKE